MSVKVRTFIVTTNTFIYFFIAWRHKNKAVRPIRTAFCMILASNV